MNRPVAFPAHIFRAYDIRGKLSLLSPELVFAIAQALARQYQAAGQTELVIGYDARLTSPSYAKLIQQICQQHGLHVELMGCCASPALYYAARHFNGNGIMVTASHNPKSDNGIKWIIQGEPPTPEMIQQVATWAKPHFKPEQKITLEHEPHTVVVKYCLDYQQGILDDIQLKARFKVVLDGLHGAAGRCAALVLEKLGCEVIQLRCKANGEFPDHAPDPSQAAHLRLLQQSVLAEQADIGIALDGDGDRVVIVDEQANIISPDRLMVLFAKICLLDHPQHEVVFDVKCSNLVANSVRDAGGTAKMIRTGSTFLRQYLAQSQGQAVFGGEYAGHYVFNDGRGFGYDDGLYAALRILEYIAQQNMSISQALADYPDRCSTEDTYISTHQQDPQQVLDCVADLSQDCPANLSQIDGVRLDFTDGFGIIRASNTGEYFTVRFDAENLERLDAIRDTFANMLQPHYPQIAQDILNAK
ncbi:phosphomannomutase/phosphoglucomutase [Acinetobacter sp. B51(2017)]|uniref:phosphomannomutase/phosphoglucomutase n=1 Tax=Acinetobacter sp. B51(2017) TaxID=2060938 RepID=UPI000F07601D|nr:phosphomannomutase/phosphoglucomutase [Acinetobacter sp. B51(2017)]